MNKLAGFLRSPCDCFAIAFQSSLSGRFIGYEAAFLRTPFDLGRSVGYSQFIDRTHARLPTTLVQLEPQFRLLADRIALIKLGVLVAIQHERSQPIALTSCVWRTNFHLSTGESARQNRPIVHLTSARALERDPLESIRMVIGLALSPCRTFYN